MNTIYAIGRLTKDATVFEGGVTVFTLAVDDGKDKEGNKVTQFLSFKAFGKTGELISKYCGKGSRILVEGRIRNNNYEKDGQKFYGLDLVVNRIEFLDSKSNGEMKEVAEGVSAEDSFTEIQEDMPF